MFDFKESVLFSALDWLHQKRKESTGRFTRRIRLVLQHIRDQSILSNLKQLRLSVNSTLTVVSTTSLVQILNSLVTVKETCFSSVRLRYTHSGEQLRKNRKYFYLELSGRSSPSEAI